METISIRDLRGKRLRECADEGRPLAVTNHRVLVGVFIPVATAWVEHLIEVNWSQVQQSIAESEQAIASGRTTLSTLDDPATEAAVESVTEPAASGHPKKGPMKPFSLLASVAGGIITHVPQGRRLVEELHAALNPLAARHAGANSAVQTVRIGDITAELIDHAGKKGEALAITHNRELIGMIIPVTQDLVHYLIDQNVSRVLYNVGLSEMYAKSAEKLTALDALGETDETSTALAADG